MTREITWSNRISIGISNQASADVDRLLATGYYGRNRSQVVRELFLKALRDILTAEDVLRAAWSGRK